MKKYKLKTALITIGILGSIGAISTSECIMADHKIKLEDGQHWCLSEQQLVKEHKDQIKKIKDKEGVDIEKIIAMAGYDVVYNKEVATALVDEYKNDGYVEYDNFELHMAVIENLFDGLRESNTLPNWYFEPGEFTNEQIIILLV